MKTGTLAIVQARMSSSRLPGKVLRTVPSVGMTPLEMLLRRLKRAREVDEIVVATSDEPADAEIERAAAALGFEAFRGPLADVLERFHRCAETRLSPPATVVRITADCPWTDPAIVDEVVRLYRTECADYASNTLDLSYPDGLDVEVLSAKALREARDEARDPYDREHVTPFIVRNSSWRGGARYRSACLASPYVDADLRITLDYPDDFTLLDALAGALGPDAEYREIRTRLRERPDWIRLNSARVAKKAEP